MQATIEQVPTSTGARWTGRIFSALATLFMLMDGGMKLFNPPPVMESMTLLDYPPHLTPLIGGIALLCVVVYVIPRTAVLGAVLLTGYLGGAMAAQIRIEAPLFSLVFPLIIGALFWAGLYLREPRLRELVPVIERG